MAPITGVLLTVNELCQKCCLCVSESGQSPPSYGSLFGRVVAAKEESSNPGTFLQSLLSIFTHTSMLTTSHYSFPLLFYRFL